MSTKTYTSPQLSLKGSAIELTNTVSVGIGDPEGTLRSAPAGTLGFLL
jgi:hypothetical protein